MGNRVVQNGFTPLHFAAQKGQEAKIEALVAAKADVHAKNNVRVGQGVMLGG